MRARAYYLAIIAVIVLNIGVAAQYVSHVPTADGWAVWNRIMLLDFGQLSFRDYLLRFFGAHPHSIILLLSLLDHRLVDADQSLLALVTFASVAAFALFCAHRFLAWAKINGASGSGVLLGGVAIAALATTLADSQVMTLPFQAVLSSSRLVYVWLLWWLIGSLRIGSALRLSIVTAASCLAVTFHGTGLLFSLVFLLVHVLRYRGIGRCLGGAAPLAVVLLQAYFYKEGGSELDGLGAIGSTGGFIHASKALFAYFATPLLPFRGSLGDRILLIIGVAVFAFLAWLAAHCLLGQATRRIRRSAARPTDDERLFAGALSLLVLMSGAAAAILMAIRGGADSYRLTFDSSRYIAYALLAYILIVCTLVRALGGKSRYKRLAMLIAGALGALGLYPAAVFSSEYQSDVRLNQAVAAMSVGMSPHMPPANAVWPAAKDDWYWADAFPATVSHFMKERAGPWSHLPSLGQRYVGPERTPEVTILGTAGCSPSCPGDVIHFTGSLSTRTDGAFLRSRTVPIVGAAGTVIGFAVQVRPQAVSRRREFYGYLVADGSAPTDRIFVGPSDGAYDDAVRSARDLRPQR